MSSLLVLVSCAQLAGLDKDYRVAPGSGGGGEGGAGDVAAASGGNSMTEPPGTGGSDPDGVPSLPEGLLVFHRYSGYEAGDSQMFLAQLPSGDLLPGGEESIELGEHFGVCNPIDGNLQPGGERLAFVAMPQNGDGSCPGFARERLELYVVDVHGLDEESPEAQRLTDNSVPDEDPSFSPDGSTIYLKHNSRIVGLPTTGNTVFSGCESVSAGGSCLGDGSGEQSMPVATLDGTEICYREGNHTNSSSDIYCVPLSTEIAEGESLELTRRLAAANDAISIARPAIHGDYLYYRRWWAPSGSENSRIARTKLNDLDEERGAFCDDQASNYTDPLPLSDELIIYSANDSPGAFHELHVAKFQEIRNWPIDELTTGESSINEGREEDHVMSAHFVAK